MSGLADRLMRGGLPNMAIRGSQLFFRFALSFYIVSQLGLEAFTLATVGLLIGGVVAAPFGAVLAKRVPSKALMLMVGIVLTATSVYGLWRALA